MRVQAVFSTLCILCDDLPSFSRYFCTLNKLEKYDLNYRVLAPRRARGFLCSLVVTTQTGALRAPAPPPSLYESLPRDWWWRKSVRNSSEIPESVFIQENMSASFAVFLFFLVTLCSKTDVIVGGTEVWIPCLLFWNIPAWVLQIEDS
jgi:hypothetical protein